MSQYKAQEWHLFPAYFLATYVGHFAGYLLWYRDLALDQHEHVMLIIMAPFMQWMGLTYFVDEVLRQLIFGIGFVGALLTCGLYMKKPRWGLLALFTIFVVMLSLKITGAYEMTF